MDNKVEPVEAFSGGGSRGVYRYRFDNVDFDESTSSLRVADQPVAVEPLPLELLAELLRRPNEVITRAELFDLLWPGRVTVDHVLANAVNKLRRALGAEAAGRLVNVPRVGYRFAGSVERTAAGRRQPTVAPTLAAGQPVPGREALLLERPMAGAAAKDVWLAREPKLQWLRVFKFAYDADQLASLKREYTVYRVLRRSLGERDDFARVLSANFSDAPYFLECEYGGPDLAHWAAEDQQLQAFGVPERLALFLQIAHAVADAHRVGVLHKDLKPANVLIGGSSGAWQARLTDFGNSRLLEPGRLADLGVTAMGLTVTQGVDTSGTPLYLAPELLAGQPPTTASDLYALGLMLYQLLVGDFRRPMSTGWQRDIDDSLLVEDLTAATEGRPEDRLGSVSDLVERLSSLERRRAERAMRAAEMTQAHEAASQLQKSRARRPWVGAAFASLGLGLAGSLWFYSQAASALHLAEQESARAQAINDFMTKDVLQSADVMRSAATKTVSMVDVLRRASERAGDRFKGQPRTEASVRRQLGDIFLRMRFLAEADEQFAKALALLAPLVPASDPEVLAIRFGSVQTSVDVFRPEEALKKLEVAERAASPEVLNGNSELAVKAARARLEAMMDAKQHQQALPIALRLVELSDRLPGTEMGPRFEARQLLCELYVRLDEKTKADALLAEITRPPYSESSVGEVVFARAKLRLGRARINEGKLAEAETLLTEVRDTMTRAFGPNQLHVGGANLELADLHHGQGNFAKAAEAAKAAVVAFTASLGDQHNYVTIAKANVAAIELDLGEPAHALRDLDEVRPSAAANRSASALLAEIDFVRAKAMTDLGRPAEALAIFEATNADLLADSSWGPRDFQWQLQVEKGRALIALGQAKQGVALVRPAVAEMQKIGSYPWLLERYKKLLHEPARPITAPAPATAQSRT